MVITAIPFLKFKMEVIIIAQTTNYGLYVTDDVTETFQSWREGMNATSDSNMTKIDSIIANRTKIYTASCTTVAGTDEKVASLDDSTGFSLTAGVMVAVRFTYGNSAATPLLNVNRTGAKKIVLPSSAANYIEGNGTTYNAWGAHETILFTYTGTHWAHTPSGYLGYLAYNLASSPSEIFVATYDSTIYADIEEAYEANKVIICKDGAMCAPLGEYSSGAFSFYYTSDTAITVFKIDEFRGWSSNEITVPFSPSSQSGNNGKFLTTDGSTLSWATKPAYTASEVGAVAASTVGAANGVVPLNASGKIESTYLPSYVDDVIEGYYYNSKFYKELSHTTEIPGETGKIFVDLSTNKTYRYGGSSFTEIAQGSVVSVSRDLTSGTKIGTLTINGTPTDLYAPSTMTVNGAASTIISNNLTTSRALISNSSGKVAVSTVTSAELGHLSGVTSAIQTQLNSKQGQIVASGLLKGDGAGNISPAEPDVDYQTPLAAGTDYQEPLPGIAGNSGKFLSVDIDDGIVWSDLPTASTNNLGIVKLSNATDSTSTSLAATANAVRLAYELASNKQPAGNYKTTQTAKSSPTAGSTGATAFIDTISQNTNGEITATKKPVTFPVTSVNSKTGAVALVAADLGFGYGTCDTAATTAAKIVTLSSYALVTNGIVSVKFTNSVPANATLNINSKGAKAIYYKGAAITAGIIRSGDIVTFIYDGLYYHLIAINRWGTDIANKQDIVDVTGLLKSDEFGVIVAAEPNVDYQTPLYAGTDYQTPIDKNRLTYYGECTTAATTQAKTVSITGFPTTLTAGLSVKVKFTYAQTYNGAPTLNVNSTGAKTIRRVNGTSAAQYEWVAGEILNLVYDGSYWTLVDGGLATTTYYGVTKLSSAINSTSETLAATPRAVKDAYDRADNAYDLADSKQPAININGLLKGEGLGVISAAIAGTDYARPSDIPVKTSDLTNDSGFLTETDIFVAEYDSTTYSEIVEAYEAEKLIFCTDSSKSFYAPLGEHLNNSFSFYLVESNSATYYQIDSANEWATGSIPFPSTSLNGVTTASPSFYAPTTAGSSGQYLKSNGSGAPTWTTGNTIEYIKGTQSASTNAWTGVTADTALYDGKMILYVLPYAGTSSGATLNLTLSGGGTSGAKNIYRYGSSTAITTHYAAGSRIFLIYDGVNGRWNSSAWYYSNTNTLLRTYKATNSIELPLLLRNSNASQTAGNNEITTSADSYGAIAGTNSPTINPSTGVLTANGGINTPTINGMPTIFMAQYNSTTYEEIQTAYSNGKIIICNDGATYAPLVKYTSGAFGTFSFYCVSDTEILVFEINESSGWTTDTITIPSISNNRFTYYGVCDTAADTQAKTVTIQDFPTTLTTGLSVRVKFTNSQNYNGAPTLQINSTGAKTVQYKDGTNALQYEWIAGTVIDFVYNGTYWVMVNGSHATTAYYGRTRLNNSVSSSSTALAATANAVKTAYDKAVEAYNLASKILVVEYNSTSPSYSDIETAYNDGDIIFCVDGAITAVLGSFSSNKFTFYHVNNSEVISYVLTNQGAWSSASTSIGGSSSVTLNGSSTASPSFYAPTDPGNSGQILRSNGANNAPTWDSITSSGHKLYTASCTTGATTTAKVATLDDSTGFSLTSGVMVAVRFTYGNSATTPTLNVGGTGAKTIAIPSSVTAFTTGNGTTYNTWGARETILFTYTGTYWVHAPSGYLGYLTYNKANSVPTLDSGTWTPTFNTTAAISSYSAQNGWYSRVGNVITGGFYISATTNSGYTSTAIQINGFPFTPQYASFFGGAAANVYTAANTIFHSWNISTTGAITGRAQPCNKTSAGALSVTTGVYYPASSTITLSGTFSIIVA